MVAKLYGMNLGMGELKLLERFCLHADEQTYECPPWRIRSFSSFKVKNVTQNISSSGSWIPLIFNPFILFNAYFGLPIFYKNSKFSISLLCPVFFRKTLLQLCTTNNIWKHPPRENNPIRISYFLDGCTQRIKIQVGILKLQKTKKYIHFFILYLKMKFSVYSVRKRWWYRGLIMHSCRRVKKIVVF